jgi:hypothetical protein
LPMRSRRLVPSWAEAVMAFIESMSGDVRELDYGKDESGSDV